MGTIYNHQADLDRYIDDAYHYDKFINQKQ